MRGLRGQRGIVLLVFAAIFLMGFSAALIYALGKWRDPTTASRNSNAEVLQQAKVALIGYVAKEVLDLTESVPGRLPCPETLGSPGTNNEGSAGASCAPAFAAARTIGRLPWRTLGVDKLVDASSEPLWYAVSPNWVLGSSTPIINAGTAGQMSVDSTSDIVAAIIAPGAPVIVNPNANQLAAGCVARTQSRVADRAHNASSTTNLDYRDYLECQDASLVAFRSSVIDNPTNAVSNDQIIFITSKDILNAIQGPLAERMQRTVAPLLNEYSTSWIASGTILSTPSAPQTNTTLARFMPYATPFTAPETGLAPQSHCGSTTPTREGLLPIASMALSGPCASPWQGFGWSGSVGNTACSTNGSGAASCQFDYYTLRTINFPFIGSVNLFGLLGIASPATTNVTLQASAPFAASTFRKGLAASDFTINPTGSVRSASFTQTPSAVNGGADLSVQLQISAGALCVDTPSQSIVCKALGTFGDICSSLFSGFICGILSSVANEALTTSNTVRVAFPALSDAAPVQGTQLSAAVMNGVTPPMSLLSPSAGQPHYWFFTNQWYRYTYYGISPNVSAAATGGDLTVTNFPGSGGGTTQRFVLVMMGPAVTGQVRASGAAVDKYVEGANAVTTPPRTTFAWQVYANGGNDRLATCPYVLGSTLCD